MRYGCHQGSRSLECDNGAKVEGAAARATQPRRGRLLASRVAEPLTRLIQALSSSPRHRAWTPTDSLGASVARLHLPLRAACARLSTSRTRTGRRGSGLKPEEDEVEGPASQPQETQPSAGRPLARSLPVEVALTAGFPAAVGQSTTRALAAAAAAAGAAL